MVIERCVKVKIKPIWCFGKNCVYSSNICYYSNDLGSLSNNRIVKEIIPDGGCHSEMYIFLHSLEFVFQLFRKKEMFKAIRTWDLLIQFSPIIMFVITSYPGCYSLYRIGLWYSLMASMENFFIFPFFQLSLGIDFIIFLDNISSLFLCFAISILSLLFRFKSFLILMWYLVTLKPPFLQLQFFLRVH